MSRGWKIAAGIWGVLWAFVLVAATVPAHQAMSNLSSWADLLGLTSAARFLARDGVDLAGKIVAVLAIALIEGAYWGLKIVKGPLRDDY